MKTETIKSELKAALKYVNRKDFNLYVVKEMLNQLMILVESELGKKTNGKDL